MNPTAAEADIMERTPEDYRDKGTPHEEDLARFLSERDSMPRRHCSVHNREEFKYESLEHELAAEADMVIERGDTVTFLDKGELKEGVVQDFAPRVFGGPGCNLLTSAGWVDSPSILSLSKNGETVWEKEGRHG